ncbi:hypothetical protein KAU43_01800 [candidate division WOR-3 bacterium]|jgi:hypothetical protein|nr:hypothetical protein [candidate division WOR-3 bacterium]
MKQTIYSIKRKNERRLKMKRSLIIITVLVLVVGYFTGCGLNPVNSDKNAIEDILTGDTSWFTPDTHYGEESTSTSAMTAFDEVYLWYRTKNPDEPITREIHIDVIGDSAFATVTGYIPGILHIFASLSNDTVIIEKNFTDVWTRSAIFKKDTVASHHRGWRLYAISGVEITTDNNTIQIDSVRVTLPATGLDTLITDVTNLVQKENVIKVRPDDLANITIYTNQGDSFAFLHSHFWRWRFYADSTTPGIYNRTWKTPHNLGHYRVGFDVLTNGTLTDDSIPYDANLWGLHYLVTAE